MTSIKSFLLSFHRTDVKRISQISYELTVSNSPSFLRNSALLSRTIKSVSSNNANIKKITLPDEGVRLNKCLLGLSRRAADDAIIQGRVTINGKVASVGDRVMSRDIVKLDTQVQRWENVALAKQTLPSKCIEKRDFIYLKYWKPRGVTCTSDLNDKFNIIKAGGFDLLPQRMFSVGRLDKDSTGLILLTSDGRINNAMLSPHVMKKKEYHVEFNVVPTDYQICQLQQGVTITTPNQRDNGIKFISAKTLPCECTRVGGVKSKQVKIILKEGRNRQIRRMAEAVGLEVIKLHRTQFCGMSLKGLSEGNWKELDEKEMGIILKSLEETKSNSKEDDFIKDMED